VVEFNKILGHIRVCWTFRNRHCWLIKSFQTRRKLKIMLVP